MGGLFHQGQFVLHSGMASRFLIDCAALTDEDLAVLAAEAASLIEAFGSVEGIPDGGLRFARALEPYVSKGMPLIVDDVLTTGASMEKQRGERDCKGVVIWARGIWPTWVTPLNVWWPYVRQSLQLRCWRNR